MGAEKAKNIAAAVGWRRCLGRFGHRDRRILWGCERHHPGRAARCLRGEKVGAERVRGISCAGV